MVCKNVTLRTREISPREHEVLLGTGYHTNDENMRRIALCTHKEDADDIVKALKFAHEHGVV